MSIAVPLYGFGASGGGSGGTLTVTAPANVTVTVSKDGKTKTKNSGTSGVVVFKGLASGTWTVTITGDGKTAQKNVVVTADYSTAISFSTIPEFTYTGDFEIVNDSDKPITVSQDNWKIRFLTSGTLTFTNLNGAENGIDVFLVGGGGGAKNWDATYCGPAGGGGYTRTEGNVTVSAGESYSIQVGAGGEAGSGSFNGSSGNGGTTKAFGQSASGGNGISSGQMHNGANGGSGGAGLSQTAIYGGVDGADGASGYGSGGKGAGTTTREFGESNGKAYASGGNCILEQSGANGTANTGNGGNGGCTGTGGTGGSGIVIIRNARRAA